MNDPIQSRDSPATISDRLSRIEVMAGNMAGDIADIKSALRAVAENAFPRTEANSRSAEYDRRMLEITSALGNRLETQTYQVAHDALIQRVARLESNPQRTVAWWGLAISGGVGCLAALATLLGVAVSVAAIIISLLK